MLECRQWCLHLHIVFHEYLSLSLFVQRILLHICSIHHFLLPVYFDAAVKNVLLIFAYDVGFECSLKFKWKNTIRGNTMMSSKMFNITFVLSTLYQLFCADELHIYFNNWQCVKTSEINFIIENTVFMRLIDGTKG